MKIIVVVKKGVNNMPTCKDCLHYNVCQYHIDEETKMTVAECSYGFKNKSDYVKVKHGKWLMCLTDEPWQKGYHGRCSVCGKFYTYNINEMPRRCNYCDALMDVYEEKNEKM